MLFHEERFASLVQGHPQLSNSAIGRLIAEEWKDMDREQRQYYERMLDIIQEDY